MHVDLFGHLAQGQWFERGNALPEEPFLQFHDLRRDLEDGLAPLVECLDEPVGIGQLLVQPAARFLVRRAIAQFDKIAAIDHQTRQRCLVQLDLPAIRAFLDQHIGDDRSLGCAAKGETRLGIILPQFAQHIGEILVIDVTHALQAGEFSARDQVEIVDQPRHARVVTVRLFRLQRQTFREAARANSCRLQRLDQFQRAFHLGNRGAKLGRNFA